MNGRLVDGSMNRWCESLQVSRPFLLNVGGSQAMEVDSSLVIDWNGRSRRTRKPPPQTYWEEYVATDPWYVRELLADVPAEEYHAALEDENWDNDGEGEEGDETEDDVDNEETDESYSESMHVSSDESDTCDEGSGQSLSTDVDSADLPTRPASARYEPHTPTTTPPTAAATESGAIEHKIRVIAARAPQKVEACEGFGRGEAANAGGS